LCNANARLCIALPPMAIKCVLILVCSVIRLFIIGQLVNVDSVYILPKLFWPFQADSFFSDTN
jgi:hypothetical protein